MINLLTHLESLNKENKEEASVITSLVRFTKIKPFKERKVLEIGYSAFESQKKQRNKSPGEYIRKRIIKKIIRPLIEAGKEKDLLEYIHPELKVEIFPGEIEMVRISENEKEILYVPAIKELKYRYHYGKRKKTGETVVSFEFLFADIIMYSEIKKFFAELSVKNREEREESIPYSKIGEWIRSEIGKAETYYPDLDKSPFLKENAVKACQKMGYKISPGGKKISPSAAGILIALCTGNTHAELLLANQYRSIRTSPLEQMFFFLASEYEERRERYKANEKLNGDYASSYETKKNIPLHIQKAMETSEFNNFFGFVEFDEDTDTEKVEKIVKEYRFLSDFLGISKLEDYKLRFRKLGKHKAEGIYFPQFGCMCVDINYPNALPHELWHLLDYKNNELSMQYSFLPVWEKYVQELDKNIKRLNIEAKGKYNRSYYASKAESFARCGEIYLSRICGMHNSLVNREEISGFAYPDDPALNSAIKNYFDSLLKKGV